jgi:DNA polymerase-4
MGESAIIHVNIIDYGAAVAQAADSSLRGIPFVITAQRGNRRIVLTPSQIARNEGIERGMPLTLAQRRLPGLRILHPDPALMDRADTALRRIIDTYSPTVSGESGGHLYLDMGGTTRLFGPPVDSALRLKRAIREEVGIEASVAVASNKLVAKVGTRAVRPYGLTQIESGTEEAFLATQDISLLSGVGSTTEALLKAVGITQIGELAVLDDGQVLAFLGRRGIALRDRARGLDSSPFLPTVTTGRTIARTVHFNEPLLAAAGLKAGLITASEDAALQMRGENLCCSCVAITLLYSDAQQQSAAVRTAEPWYYDHQIEEAAQRAADRAALRRIRLLGFKLTLSSLSPATLQSELFTPALEVKRRQIQESVDALRLRYGVDSVVHASALYHGN